MTTGQLSPLPVPQDGRSAARDVASVRRRLEAQGVNISDWARAQGFSPTLVHQVLRGRRPCRRGESHRIAVALGLKLGNDDGSILADPS